MSVLQRVKTVMIEKFGIDNDDSITPEFTFDNDLQFKDRFLDMIEFKMELENEFDISIDEEDFDRISTVGDLVNCIERMNPKD
jgi:acyl carrier protein